MIKAGIISKLLIPEIYSYFYENNYCVYHTIKCEIPFTIKQDKISRTEFIYTNIFV